MSRRARLVAIGVLTLAVVVTLGFVSPIPQDPSYHAFADRRAGENRHRPRRKFQRAEKAGKPAADKEALAETLVAVSKMAAALAPRLKELDINPVFVGPAGAGVVAADALVVLK